MSTTWRPPPRIPRELTQKLETVLKVQIEADLEAGTKTRSILELCGLGKEIWEGIDPAEYIREERESWDS